MADHEQLADQVERIRRFPDELEPLVRGLDRAQLDTPLREGGWTLRQIAHHLVDSHINIYIRMRLILTEDYPTLQPFDQDSWAKLPDAHKAGLSGSLAMLRGLHMRTVELLEVLEPKDFQRASFHPEEGELTLADLVQALDQHSGHHLNQIQELLRNKGWAGARTTRMQES